jgi:O-antigen/teichoic acid export membrane protein
MGLVGTLGSRFVLLVAGRAVMLGLALVTTGILTRTLGPAGFGHYRVAVAYLGLVVMLSDLGLASIFVREIARPGADQIRVTGNALGLRLALAGGAMLIALALSRVLAFDTGARLGILGGALGFVAYSLHLMLFGLFQQQLRQQGVVLAEVGGAVLLLVLVLILAPLGAQPVWFVMALGLSYGFMLLLSVRFARRLLPFGLRFDLPRWRQLVHFCLPVATANTIAILYFHADTVLLALLQGPEAVGLYGVPIKIFDSLLGVSILIVGLFAPLLARAAGSDAQAFARLLGDSLGVLCVGVIGGALGLSAIAPEVVRLLGGAAFAGAAVILRLLTILLVLHTATALLREAAIALQIQHRLVPGYLLGLVAAAVLYVLLIPRYAGAGAAWTLILAESLVVAWVAVVLIKATSAPLRLDIPLRAAACGVGAGLALYAVEQAGWGVPARLSIAAAVYVVLLLVTRSLRRPEFAL